MDKYVVAVFAACLVLLGLASQSRQPEQNRYQSYRTTQKDLQRLDAAGLNLPAPGKYQTPCDHPTGEGEADLCAQWKAAVATENSVAWAGRSFWVALIGSALLLWQIGLTRKAVADTTEATEAMREANDIARKNAEIDQRPWLDFEIDNIKLTINETEISVLFDANLQNLGKTPARRVMTVTAVMVHGVFHKLPDLSDLLIGEQKRVQDNQSFLGKVIFPNQNDTITDVGNFSNSDILKGYRIIRSPIWITLAVRVIYRSERGVRSTDRYVRIAGKPFGPAIGTASQGLDPDLSVQPISWIPILGGDST